ncbi:MAG: hypothetical protein JSV16_13330 [Candidatus Hydrogenedentota bacterium]|nr:MAG: hypothetical protein JSV16_13330 [Candidatus Hydrogenedentota bacterium]
MDWGLIGAAAINTVGVLLAVQALKIYLPIVRQKLPWLLPAIAPMVGMGLSYGTEALTAFLGHPVDLGPILAILTGAAAVTAHQIKVQARH